MASQLLKFHQVTSLPMTLNPDSFYFVLNGTIAEGYLTDNSGVAKSIGNTSMIQAIVNSSLADFNTVEIVVDIAARDALTLTRNAMVLVLDATADMSVASGAALYAYKESNDTFTKIAEYESMDVTVTWASISGKPTSTPSQIDTAVNNSHTHSNLTQLNKVGEDANGDLTYNGASVGVWNTNNW